MFSVGVIATDLEAMQSRLQVRELKYCNDCKFATREIFTGLP